MGERQNAEDGMINKTNEDIASEPYVARGDDASGKKLCFACLEKGCKITLLKLGPCGSNNSDL